MTQAKRRGDYQSPVFVIDSIELLFQLNPTATRVVATSSVRRLTPGKLWFDGVGLKLGAVAIDGQACNTYQLEEEGMWLECDKDTFELKIETFVAPDKNTSLEGLYLSDGAYCTQCEAEGFRKITYFPDRPDVLTEYRVRIEADKAQFPYLLSNGNLIERGDLNNGHHYVSWHDPFKKPCYLFALVAGDFALLEDNYVTGSGREVALQLFVDKGNEHKGDFAIASLKKAMAWDEQRYGLEYDLDIYMIVAVDFFNMGAMENKGLNIFNSRFVLVDPASATDEDFFNVESVIAHEYFHNWTGNRVTCRDWFQLSLKEGLTVFRDQQFSADMGSAALTRIKQAKVIREQQFAEDAGPMSHPIRPDEVVEMNNFYTVTVYDKGAEVIRMLHSILGEQGFIKGMQCYFQRHDGQAVTCDDFVSAMADANNKDLSQFRRWYSQSGTPEVTVTAHYDETQRVLKLNMKQHTPATADQRHKVALPIPISLALLDDAGEMTFDQSGEVSTTLTLEQPEQTFDIDCMAPVAIDVLRNFSAPVKLHFSQTTAQRVHIALHSTDGFARFEAIQQVYEEAIESCVTEHQGKWHDDAVGLIADAQQQILQQANDDKALLVEMLTLPSIERMLQRMQNVTLEHLVLACDELARYLAKPHAGFWQEVDLAVENAYRYDVSQVAQRKWQNHALLQCMLADPDATMAIAEQRFYSSDNMTDTLGALKACQQTHIAGFEGLMAEFESRWKMVPLVMDKWLSLHATSHRPDILARLDLLKDHQSFTHRNPNRVRALIGSFGFYNTRSLFERSGAGVKWYTQQLRQIDAINPQVSARLVTPLLNFKALDSARRDFCYHGLLSLADQLDLSKDLGEKVSKAIKQFKQDL